MYETVKEVNGYKIKRMKGTHGHYHVTIKKYKNGTEQYVTFKTIKSAVKYCEKL